MKPTVYLIDASIYIFRAWFSIEDDFRNSEGHSTNAVYGFTGFLCSILEQTQAKHIAVAFDESLEQSFRNEIYPAYKANRDPAPLELKRQFAGCRQVSESLGLASFASSRYEADDIIGTLAEIYKKKGFAVSMVSADKDLSQLMSYDDELWDFARNIHHDWDSIENKFGVQPDQIVDYLALCGDNVDNIPGVPGIGAKAAAVLLKHFGDLDELLKRVDEVAHLRIRGAKSIAAKIKKHRDIALLSRKLTQIHTQIPEIDPSLNLERGSIDANKIEQLFDQFGFGNLLRRRCLALK